jgi:ABC-type branched-subunit amino acid transport system substrate-binding protein
MSYYGVEGFVTIKVLVEGIRKAGKDLDREKLVNALDGMREFDTGGHKVAFSPGSRSGSKYVDLTVIGQGGRVLR